MSNIVATREGDMVFGIFNTPDNSIPGSAVCSFRMSEIQESFEGAFKAQNHVNANWLPLDDRDLPKHRPGRCHNDSRSLDEEHLNFLKENMLMDKAVPSSIHLPHYIKTSPHERLTAIAVDPSVAAAGGETADLLFVGTTRGRVLKLASHRGKTHLVEELQVFPLHVAVNNLLVAKEEEGKKSRLVVLSDHEVKSVPVARCHSANLRSCAECVALQVGTVHHNSFQLPLMLSLNVPCKRSTRLKPSVLTLPPNPACRDSSAGCPLAKNILNQFHEILSTILPPLLSS